MAIVGGEDVTITEEVTIGTELDRDCTEAWAALLTPRLVSSFTIRDSSGTCRQTRSERHSDAAVHPAGPDLSGCECGSYDRVEGRGQLLRL